MEVNRYKKEWDFWQLTKSWLLSVLLGTIIFSMIASSIYDGSGDFEEEFAIMLFLSGIFSAPTLFLSCAALGIAHRIGKTVNAYIFITSIAIAVVPVATVSLVAEVTMSDVLVNGGPITLSLVIYSVVGIALFYYFMHKARRGKERDYDPNVL